MSQENVALVYRIADALNRRDLDASLALMDDDVQAFPQVAAMEGNYEGHGGIRRWWKSLFDVFPDFTGEVVEVRDLGDMTVTAVIIRGHGAGSDVPTEDTVWLVHRWRDGKCVWWRTFQTRAEALKAVGLSEQDAHADS